MNEISKVSIIMPSFNVKSVILTTIDSVLAQTYSDWELIIIDDCSNDGTVELLSEIYGQDSRVIILSNSQNSGAGFSRNVGLEVASGRFIAFLDSDDIWSKDKLFLQVQHMLDKKAPISHTSFSFVDEKGNDRAGYVKASKIVTLTDNLRKTEIGTSTAMIDKAIVGSDFSFSLQRSRQDLLLWIDLLGRGHASYGLDSPLVKYRVRNGSVSSNKLLMLLVTLKVYMSVRTLPLRTRLFCYGSYVGSALLKRCTRI